MRSSSPPRKTTHTDLRLLPLLCIMLLAVSLFCVATPTQAAVYESTDGNSDIAGESGGGDPDGGELKTGKSTIDYSPQIPSYKEADRNPHSLLARIRALLAKVLHPTLSYDETE